MFPWKRLILVCAVLNIVGLLIFLKGFFPIKNSLPGYASNLNLTTEPAYEAQLPKNSFREELLPAPYNRMVFILIDALRADFVLPCDGDLPRMEFVESLINKKETHSFLAKASPPTVTMPRIKVSIDSIRDLTLSALEL